MASLLEQRIGWVCKGFGLYGKFGGTASRFFMGLQGVEIVWVSLLQKRIDFVWLCRGWGLLW